MKLWLAALALLCSARAADRVYELRGAITPKAVASVSLHGAVTPFQASTLSDSSGRFRFKGLQADTYTLIIFVRGVGETRRTIEVGPSLADPRGRVAVHIEIHDSAVAPDRSSVVSVRELSIPRAAQRDYAQASERLGRRDSAGAEALLRRAVERAPQYVDAWNFLGTLAYQTARYDEAERRFRRALSIDESAYSPLVNLGGVLVTLGRFEEARGYNQRATLSRPSDPLAHSQLGMSYLGLNQLPQAEKSLLEAIRLDPGHFSHPQLVLAEVYARQGRNPEAAAMLEDLLRRHPDLSGAAALREAIGKLRR